MLLRGYWLVCIAGTVAAVAVTTVLSGPVAVLWILFPAVAVVLATYPWLSPLESAARSRRTIWLLCCAAAIAGAPWMPVAWGFGFVAVPVAVALPCLYAFGARVAAEELWPRRHRAPGMKLPHHLGS
ncbi:hypothetical protein GCM10027089_35730 [Nocardia thraciensis]